MAPHEENPFVVVATTVALAGLVAVGVTGLPWARSLSASLWAVVLLAAVAVNVVSVRLRAAGLRPGRLFLYPSVAGHLCWAVGALAMALPHLSWGATPTLLSSHMPASVLRWLAIALAGVGGFLQRRASKALVPVAHE